MCQKTIFKGRILITGNLQINHFGGGSKDPDFKKTKYKKNIIFETLEKIFFFCIKNMKKTNYTVCFNTLILIKYIICL
jgi:hypothetical protein